MNGWKTIDSAPVPEEVWDSSDMVMVWNGEYVLPCIIQRLISGPRFQDRSDADRDGDYAEVYPEPTHWMPFPTPPVS